MCFGVSEEQALELALLARIAGGSTPAPPAPDPPSDLLISPTTTNGNVILSWTASPSSPDNYEVWRSTNDGVTYTLLKTVSGVTLTTVDAVVIPSGNKYHYKVRAVKSSVNSTFTNGAGIYRNPSAGSFGLGNVLDSDYQFQLENLTFSVLPGLISVSFPNLHTTTGLLTIEDTASVTSVSLPKLKTVGGNLTIDVLSITTLNLASLVTAAQIQISGHGLLQSIFLPVLTNAGALFNFFGNGSLTTLSVPVLTTIGATGISATGATALTSLSFPSLVTCTGGMDIGGCTSLTSVSFPNIVFTDGTLVGFDGDALTDTSVNHILARGVASATTTCDYELNSPGNAAPTGQGVLDKATLVGAGNIVNTN